MASPSTPVYTIALTDPLWVRAYVPETELGKVALGMRASIGTDSFPGRTYRGWVGYLSPTAEFTPKTSRARNCARGSSISSASMSAIRAASCGSECRRPSRSTCRSRTADRKQDAASRMRSWQCRRTSEAGPAVLLERVGKSFAAGGPDGYGARRDQRADRDEAASPASSGRTAPARRR